MYVLSFFREFAPALHLAISTDMIHWEEMNDQEPILESQVGVKYWRDPFIIRAQDGQFHLLCTDGWASPNIIHASSRNLCDWSSQQVIPVMQHFPSAKNAWAPEACYDVQRKEYRIFWSSTVPDHFQQPANKTKDYQNHRIYSCTTKDFHTFSKTELYFDPGYNCIDASITYHNNQYFMAYKDERGENNAFPEDLARKHILIAKNSTLVTPWQIDSQPISKSSYSEKLISSTIPNDKNTWAEGPCIIWNNLRQEWWVFYEYFRTHKYGAVRSKDGKIWENVDHILDFPPGAKHATVFEVADDKIIAELKTWKNNK